MFNTLNGENDKSLTEITMKPLIFVGAPMIAIGEATDINEDSRVQIRSFSGGSF